MSRTRLPETSEYRAWINMRQRCFNERHSSYKYYGGRGITICDRWKSFQNFISDMGMKPSSKHSIDRINNDGNYEPTNCRWATDLEQQNNSRQCRNIVYLGQQMTIMEAIRAAGSVPKKYAVLQRINQLGWDLSRAVETPSSMKDTLEWQNNRIKHDWRSCLTSDEMKTIEESDNALIALEKVRDDYQRGLGRDRSIIINRAIQRVKYNLKAKREK